MRFALLPLILLALPGCSWVTELEPMPTGYAYYQEVYKAQPGPEAESIGYPWSAERNAVVLEKWQAVAGVLVDRLESQLNFRPQAVYVQMMPNKNAFNFSLDFVLRRELKSRGYVVVEKPGHALVLRPEAYLPKDNIVSSELRNFNGEPDPLVAPRNPERADRFIITLDALRDDEFLGKVGDTFFIPAYGYVSGEGRQKYRNRIDKEFGPAPIKAKHARKPAPEPDQEDDAPGMPQLLVPEAVQSEVIQ